MAVAVVSAISLGRSSPAEAHAALQRSAPADGDQLADPPELVELWHTEPIEPALTSLRVFDTDGAMLSTGSIVFSDDDARYAAARVPPDIGPGIYTVSYQNVSKIDGHQWTGSFSFVVLSPDGSLPAGTAFVPTGGNRAPGYLPEIGDTTLRWIGLLASVVVVGAIAFHLLVARPAANFLGPQPRHQLNETAGLFVADLIMMAAPLVAFATVGQLFLLADRLGGTHTLDTILLDTHTGRVWISRLALTLALMVLFLPALRIGRRRLEDQAKIITLLGFPVGLGILMTFSLVGHGAATDRAVLSVSSDFVHFAAAATWLGALLQMPLLFWWAQSLDRPQRLVYEARALDRFSWVAAASVALLIASGVLNGFAELPALDALWETTYGRVLIAKLLLILPLLAVAGINAILLKPALVRAVASLREMQPGDAGDLEQPRLQLRLERLRRAIPRTIAAELLLGAVVLASVSVLVQTTPARGELAQASSSEERGSSLETPTSPAAYH